MSPSKAQARKLVLIGVLVLAVMAVYRGRAGYTDTTRPDADTLFRRLWGVGVVGLMLTLLADFAPTVAGPFAVLTVLGSATHGGDRILQAAIGGLAAPGSTRPAPAAPAAPAAPRPR